MNFEGLPSAEVRRIAQLMDGSSPLYVVSPRGNTNSMIGRCAWQDRIPPVTVCGAQIDCEVVE